MPQVLNLEPKEKKTPFASHLTDAQRAKLDRVSKATGRSISDVLGYVIEIAPEPKCAKK